MPTDPSPYILDLVEGANATPEHPNNSAEFSNGWQDLWEVAHRASDQEHQGPEVAQCSGIVHWSGAAYTILKGKGISTGAGQITRAAAGDLTISMDKCTMASILDYGVDVSASPATEPLFFKEYDDTATTNTRTTKKFRLHLFDQNGAYKDNDFRFAVYGVRSPTSITSPTLGVALNEVRNRLAVDGVESVELRNKLNAFYRAKMAAIVKKHFGPGRNYGKNRDICVPHVALFRVPASASSTVGTMVFASHGIEAGAFVHGAAMSRIFFRLKPGYRLVGARATVRHTDATAAPNALRDRTTIPKISIGSTSDTTGVAGFEAADRYGAAARSGSINLNSTAGGSGIRQVLLVAHARPIS